MWLPHTTKLIMGHERSGRQSHQGPAFFCIFSELHEAAISSIFGNLRMVMRCFSYVESVSIIYTNDHRSLKQPSVEQVGVLLKICLRGWFFPVIRLFLYKSVFLSCHCRFVCPPRNAPDPFSLHPYPQSYTCCNLIPFPRIETSFPLLICIICPIGAICVICGYTGFPQPLQEGGLFFAEVFGHK